MGSATAINTAMTAMTIISSISVKPNRRRVETGWALANASPFRIGRSIARLVHALGVHIEYILTAPGLRSGIVTIASKTPVVRIGHGVLRDAPQVFHLLVHRPGGFDS